MRLMLLVCILMLAPLNATVEKDLNLSALKKAYHWLLDISGEDSLPHDDDNKNITDITNIENVWDIYKDLMKKSIVLIRKYPKKVTAKFSTLFTQNNNDILPLMAFYFYSTERKDQTLRYYDAFKTIISPMNQDNLWMALIPFSDLHSPKINNYSVLIIDTKNNRILTKD